MPANTSPTIPSPAAKSRSRLSIDAWAVILSLTLALIVRLGLLKTVPW
jgi:hypothetical protein